MNGAAIGCQEQVLPSRADTLIQLSPGYQLEKNHLCHGNYHSTDSKIMSYHSSDSHFVGKPTGRTNLYGDGRSGSETYSARHVFREPLDLPVPRFVIDENYVGDRSCVGQSAKELDLDTRIQLLINSNALAGVLPVFSEIEESEDSNLSDRSLKRSKITETRRSAERRRDSFDLEDDPNKPLSRPPSPFLSRASYLFWFNKAIEIKEQAKEQEKALLEIANKKLNNNQALLLKPVEITPVKSEPPKSNDSCMFKNLMNELSKELKDAVREEFINEIIENTAIKLLDNLFSSTTDPSSSMDETKRQEETNMRGFPSLGDETETEPYVSCKMTVPETLLENSHPHLDHSRITTKSSSTVNGSSARHLLMTKESKNKNQMNLNRKECASTGENLVESRKECNDEVESTNQTIEAQQTNNLPKNYLGPEDEKIIHPNGKDIATKISFENLDPNKSDEEAGVLLVTDSVCAIFPKDTLSEVGMDSS